MAGPSFLNGNITDESTAYSNADFIRVVSVSAFLSRLFQRHQAMRLLKVSANGGADSLPELVDFPPDRIPPYAILSHRWNQSPAEEISFADLTKSDSPAIDLLRGKQGFQKVQNSCAQTRKQGLNYIWIDTCCIDKSSSAELSEAINTMYTWYNKAHVCFAYLGDVSSTTDLASDDSELTRTEWATRGWTLQELLAPSEMIFYSRDWREIGTKESLSSVLSVITGIDEAYLAKEKPKHLWSASVAERMSWAARRNTTRPEDVAYCLMGLFQVNMPMLYGEGSKAFIRLQEEIMKHSDDHSLFAWTAEDEVQDETTGHGLLAKHPRCFKYSGNIAPYEDRGVRAPFSMSNRGLCVELHLSLAGDMIYAAALDCPVPPTYDDSTFLAIYLKKLPYSHGQYARVKVGSFGKAWHRGPLETIYVRQSIIVPDVRGLFPTHVLQLRKFVARNTGYRAAQTMLRNYPSFKSARVMTATRRARSWVPANNPIAYKITSKAETRSLLAVHVVFEELESIVIMLGSANLQVGFNAVLTPSLELGVKERLDLFNAKFVPVAPGSTVVIGYHQVCVSAVPVVSDDVKYYMIDIQIDALERPRNLVKEVLDAREGFGTPEPYLSPPHRRTIMQRVKRLFS